MRLLSIDEAFERWPQVPEHLRGGLHRYVYHGVPTGGFLEAVLNNDLREALRRADFDSLAGLQGIVGWLWNCAPSDCWGSPSKRSAWIARGGLFPLDSKLAVPLRVGSTRYGGGGVVEFGEYGDGTVAMLIRDEATGEPQCKATVSLASLDAPALGEREVWVKSWSENEGVLEALLDAGVVERDPAPVGWAVRVDGPLAYRCRLTDAAFAELERQRGRQ